MADKVIIDVELRSGDSKNRVDDLAAAIETLKVQRRALLKAQKDAIREFGAESEQARAAAAALNDNKVKTAALNRELRILNREIVSSGGSLDDQRAKLAKLRLEYDRAVPGIDKTADEMAQLKAEIQQLDSAIKGNEESTGRFQRSVGDYSKAFRDAFSGNVPILQNFTTLLAGPIGIVTALVTGIGALGKELFDMSREIAEAKLQTEQLTGAQGELNNQVAAAGKAIEKTYGADFGATLTSANTLTRELGGNITENTEVLGNAAALTGEKFGEVLDIVKEYPAQFRGLNVGAKEFLAIATTQVQDGIYSDKGVDALKEGLLRLREMPTATRSALESIGVSGEEIQARIKDGSSTLFEELQNVSTEISKLDPQAEATGKVIAGVFGGPGEDAGQRYISTIKDINLNFDELKESASDQVRAQIELQEANQSIENSFNALLDSAGLFFQSSEVGFKKILAEGLQVSIQFLEEFINGIIETYNTSIAFRASFALAFANIKNGIEIVIAAFKNLFNAVGTVSKAVKAIFTGDFSAIPSILADGFKESVSIATEAGKNIGENFADAYDTAVNSRLEKIDITPNQVADNTDEIQKSEDKAFEIVKSSSEREKEFKKAQREEDIAEKAEFLRREQEIENEYLERRLEVIRQLNSQEISSDQQKAALLDAQKQRLEEEIALLEEFGQAKLEKEIELEQLRAEAIEAIEEEKLENLQARKEREAQIEQSTQEVIATVQESYLQAEQAKIDLNQEKRNAVVAASDAIIQKFGEESAAGRAAAIVQKAVAAVEVGIALQQELAAIDVAAAKISASAPPFSIPAGIAYGTARRTAAIIKAGISLARIAAFEKGGLTFEGQEVLMVDSHADGGWRNRPTLGLIGEKGPEYVIPNNLLRIPQVQSAVAGIERMRIRPFQDGGFSSNVVNQEALNLDIGGQIRDGFNNMPRQVLVVQDVEAGLGESVEVQQGGNI